MPGQADVAGCYQQYQDRAWRSERHMGVKRDGKLECFMEHKQWWSLWPPHSANLLRLLFLSYLGGTGEIPHKHPDKGMPGPGRWGSGEVGSEGPWASLGWAHPQAAASFATLPLPLSSARRQRWSRRRRSLPSKASGSAWNSLGGWGGTFQKTNPKQCCQCGLGAEFLLLLLLYFLYEPVKVR